ncbi:MAG: NAD(P)-binding domain-containing protein [Chthoniobacterales bacterium]
MKRIAIIGAGPIGLEAALAALDHGFDVQLFDRGQVADAVRQWGHVRMFSPFGMNATSRGLTRLQSRGEKLPETDALLIGAEFRDRYLLPLARSLPAGVLHEKTEVLAIGRSRVLKGDHIAEPTRGATPFRLLVRNATEERIVQADAVFDCSGTYAQSNGLGDGGIPAPGERATRDHIFYGIPDFAGTERERFAGRRVLVVGAGHSGATAVSGLVKLAASEIHWLLRRDRVLPAEEIPDDPLPERARLAAHSNQLVREKRVTLHRSASVESISPNDSLEVAITDADGERTITVDEIIVATGFRPDLSLARELQVQTCWATEGTYPLAASMLGEAGADCLKTPAFGAEMLMHPEPGYFTLGMKSYGRAPNFLLRTGYEQIETVLSWMEEQKAA